MIADTKQAEHLALTFDHIYLWQLHRRQLNGEERSRIYADIEYLASQGVVWRIGLDLGMTLPGVPPRGIRDCELVLPVWAALGRSPATTDGDHTDRVLLSVAAWLRQFKGIHAAAHIEPAAIPSTPHDSPALEVIVNNVPMPPAGMPWQEIVQFREDPENVQSLRRLRLWAQQQASSKKSVEQISEELESLLYDYRKYMTVQHRKFSQGVVSTIVTSTAETLAHVASLNFGKAVGALFALRERRVALEEAELRAPGREVAYVARVEEAMIV